MAQLIETTRRTILKRRELILGLSSVAIVIVLAALVLTKWHDIRQITAYGLAGGFVISILGGATVPLPIPVTAVYFTLGGILLPWAGPAIIAPIILGLACGAGEALGGLSTYATGAAASSLSKLQQNYASGRLGRLYTVMLKQTARHGAWMLFAVSAVINPFFYPVAFSMGITRFGARRFFFICLAGKIVKCSMIALSGYFGLRSLFEALGIELA
jgi:hypothetical protein